MKALRIILSLLVIVIVQSCKNNSNPAGSSDQNFIFPLNKGNEWQYDITTRYTDTINTVLSNFNFSINMSVLGDTILNSNHVFKISQRTGDSLETVTFCANTADGFYQYAYNSSTLGFPKIGTGKMYLFHGKRYSTPQDIIHSLANVKSDSIVILEPPRKIYQYPVKTGEQWSCGSNPRMDKKVLGIEKVAVTAGLFDCYKIQVIYYKADGTIDSDVTYFEYIGSKGVVKSIMQIKNISLTSVEYPDGYKLANYEQVQDLTQTNF